MLNSLRYIEPQVSRENTTESLFDEWKLHCRLYIDNPLAAIVEAQEKTGELFIDHEFKADSSSIERDKNETKINANDVVGWKRLMHLSDEPEIFRGDTGGRFGEHRGVEDVRIDADDVVQNKIGDCWFCSLISSLATRPQLLHRLFGAHQDNPNLAEKAAKVGVYALRIYYPTTHQWVYVVLDDFVPICGADDTLFGARARDPNELWPTLLEKAFAKISGCYAFMVGTSKHSMGIAYALRCLTGGDLKSMFTSNTSIDVMWMTIQDYLRRSWIVGAATKASDTGTVSEHGVVNDFGLVNGHAYSILGAIAFDDDGDRVVRIRNTWGRTEWTGAYSDASEKWTDAKKRQARWAQVDDGIFFMPIEVRIPSPSPSPLPLPSQLPSSLPSPSPLLPLSPSASPSSSLS